MASKTDLARNAADIQHSDVAVTQPEKMIRLIEAGINDDFSVYLEVDSIIVSIIICLFTLFVVILIFKNHHRLKKFELVSSDIGIGNQTFSFRPNIQDQSVAYKIWIELSTRKLGLPIDLDNDVIEEIYNSWYSFFAVTREHIKEIPVSKVRQKSTKQIIDLSIAVLNEGIRPHLTRWQARFRRWYASECSESKNLAASPQDIQRKFPEFKELSADLLAVNAILEGYRSKLHEIIHGY